MTPKENLSLWGDGESVSPETLKILKQQTFDENQPGTILKDFQILLDYIGEKGIEVSGINSFFPIKLLAEINSLPRCQNQTFSVTTIFRQSSSTILE